LFYTNPYPTQHLSILNIEKQITETGTLKKPTEKLSTGSNIRTSTVPKGPHPKVGMTGGRKPAANANKFTYAESRTAAQTLRSHARINVATPSPEWLKKMEWARKVLPNYEQDKPSEYRA